MTSPLQTEKPAPVQIETLMGYSDGQKSQFEAFARMYLENAATSLNRIESALEQNDPRLIQDVAHGLAGSSSMIGMAAMIAPSRELESLGARAQFSLVEPELTRARKALSDITAFLKAQGLLEPIA